MTSEESIRLCEESSRPRGIHNFYSLFEAAGFENDLKKRVSTYPNGQVKRELGYYVAVLDNSLCSSPEAREAYHQALDFINDYFKTAIKEKDAEISREKVAGKNHVREVELLEEATHLNNFRLVPLNLLKNKTFVISLKLK